MSGLFEHGDKVVIKKVWRFTKYQKNDIIVFKTVYAEKVIHLIDEVIYDNNGKIIGYKTKGFNNDIQDSGIRTKKDIIGKVDMSQADLNKLLLWAEQGKTTLEFALGMKDIEYDYEWESENPYEGIFFKAPKIWEKYFTSEYNYGFAKKLKEFRGNNDMMWDKFDPEGGEGRLFLSDKDEYSDKVLKRWMGKRLNDFKRSVNLLKSARNILKLNPVLGEYIEVVEVHDEGIDWIVRDFYDDSIALKKAIDKSDSAKEIRSQAIESLEDIILEKQKKRIKTPQEVIEITILQNILKKIKENNFNIHFEFSENKLIIIDMM